VALPPGDVDSFVREVDEAVRADFLQRFVAKWGRLLLVVVGAGLIGLAGWLYWQNRQVAASGETGAQFTAALDTMAASRPKAAMREVDPIAKGTQPTYRALALMVQGDAALADDEHAAAAHFAQLARDQNAPQVLRDIALLRQTLAEYDSLQPAQVIDRLKPLVDKAGPAFPLAAELTALAELRRGNNRVAGQLYKRISEAPDVPDTLKSRAVQMAGMLGVDAVQDRASAPAAGNGR